MKNAPTFKALYGTELEMSQDKLDIVVNPTDDDIYSSTYVIFDTETTGFNPGLHDSNPRLLPIGNGQQLGYYECQFLARFGRVQAYAEDTDTKQ